MRTAHWLSRVAGLSACFLLAFGLCAPPARAEKESFAGHWHLMFYGKCRITPQNIRACRDLQSPATFPAMAIPGATLTVLGVGDYTSDAAGHYRVHFVTTVTELVPGSPRPAHCTNDLVFNRTYTGTCREEGTGHGHIAPGHLHMPDFWQDDATGFWNGDPSARFAESTTTDTNNPACVGTFDTRHFMAFFGYKTVPKGITAKVVLTHRK